MTILMAHMRYFKMDRKKEELVYEIPEAEILDYWEEDSESIIYNNWDRIKDWLKNIWRFFERALCDFSGKRRRITKPHPPPSNTTFVCNK